MENGAMGGEAGLLPWLQLRLFSDSVLALEKEVELNPNPGLGATPMLPKHIQDIHTSRHHVIHTSSDNHDVQGPCSTPDPAPYSRHDFLHGFQSTAVPTESDRLRHGGQHLTPQALNLLGVFKAVIAPKNFQFAANSHGVLLGHPCTTAAAVKSIPQNDENKFKFEATLSVTPCLLLFFMRDAVQQLAAPPRGARQPKSKPFLSYHYPKDEHRP
ncbi:hypothetical protein DFH08DRAFT_821217 [Mycena albidolilacea]|uniref:Uncharacterized protein n=1 Tax=Mycena albidolilacea TaxID=1033008 RepID=A0AAD6ZAB9_9AGAR|nr:hypothetical protein DFH08DRAFT_821217 [Mycena albidolilacea]